MHPAPARSGLVLLLICLSLSALPAAAAPARLFAGVAGRPPEAPVPGPSASGLAPAARPAPSAPTAIRAEDATALLGQALPAGLYFGATWLDLDADGDLDLTLPLDSYAGGTLTVWRNDGAGFTDATAALGLAGVASARSAAWLDLDLDGDLDLYVTCRSDAPANLLFENVDGVLQRRPQGVGFDAPATDVSQAWADYDGDGDFDLYLPGIFVSRSRLLRNDGGFRFTDVTVAAGLDTLAAALAAAWATSTATATPTWPSAR